MSNAIFKRNRPLLTVESLGGKQLGRCYTQTSFRVVSTSALPMSVFTALRDAGVLDNGQGFGGVQELPDGGTCPIPAEVKWNTRPEPSGWDEVPAVDVDPRTGEPTGKPALAWNGQPAGSTRMPFWSYRVDVFCDSSD